MTYVSVAIPHNDSRNGNGGGEHLYNRTGSSAPPGFFGSCAVRSHRCCLCPYTAVKYKIIIKFKLAEGGGGCCKVTCRNHGNYPRVDFKTENRRNEGVAGREGGGGILLNKLLRGYVIQTAAVLGVLYNVLAHQPGLPHRCSTAACNRVWVCMQFTRCEPSCLSTTSMSVRLVHTANKKKNYLHCFRILRQAHLAATYGSVIVLVAQSMFGTVHTRRASYLFGDDACVAIPA